VNEAELARRIAARLTEGLESLSPEVRKRLAAARESALAGAAALPAGTFERTRAAGSAAPRLGWWGPRLLAPALGVVAALMVVLYWQQTRESPSPALVAEHGSPAGFAEQSPTTTSGEQQAPDTTPEKAAAAPPVEQPAPAASAENPAPAATDEGPAPAEPPATVANVEPLPGVEGSEVDADVLAEELPVTAYLDQGFEVWLYHATPRNGQP
jgi:hypothetical protein